MSFNCGREIHFNKIPCTFYKNRNFFCLKLHTKKLSKARIIWVYFDTSVQYLTLCHASWDCPYYRWASFTIRWPLSVAVRNEGLIITLPGPTSPTLGALFLVRCVEYVEYGTVLLQGYGSAFIYAQSDQAVQIFWSKFRGLFVILSLCIIVNHLPLFQRFVFIKKTCQSKKKVLLSFLLKKICSTSS